MGTSDLIRPLHLFCGDHEATNLLLSVLCRSERDNEVGTFFAVRLKLAHLGMYLELTGRVRGEACSELSELFHVIGQAEGDRACLVQWRLDRDDVIHFGFKSLKDCIELPSATAALVDDELNLGLEGAQRFKSQVKQNRLIR